MLPDQRSLFDIPESVVYLNCAYTAPLLNSARAEGEKALAAKGAPWGITPAHFFENLETVRGLFADLIGTEGDNIAVIPAVSYGIALAARNLPLASGEEIVTIEDQFPSNIYSWQRLARENGGQVHIVNRPPGHDWTAAVIQAIGAKTAIVALPNCHWTDGTRLDLVQIAKHCREKGAALVIDGTQSLGALPFSIGAVRPDFLVTTAHKWLLGPYSFGFCYIDPKWHDGTPLEENWLNRAGSEDFSRLVDYRDEYQPGARRFDVGEASNFCLAPIAADALRQILAWDTQRIAQTLKAKTDGVAEAAAALGFEVAPETVRSPHMIGLIHPDGIPPNLPAELAAAQVHVSIRGQSIRVAPHLYNGAEDLDRFFTVLARGMSA
ncbi:MAG: aminotransferase class V-fold PLP-dependent enzyme [Desulfosarcinaceae bacterium]|jgi:selenocysteine lyase/cysteine desulfurase